MEENMKIQRYATCKNVTKIKIHITEGLREDIPCKWKQQGDGVAILISNKTYLKTIIAKKRQWKISTQLEDITVMNIYVPSTRTCTKVKLILLDLKR